MYNLESTKRGIATKAYLFQDVTAWGLEGHTLALARETSIEVKDLREKTTRTVVQWDKCSCDSRLLGSTSRDQRFMCTEKVAHVTPLPCGDVVAAYALHPADSEPPSNHWVGDRTRTLARHGKVSWRLEDLEKLRGIVVGRQAIFSIEHDQPDQLHFVVRSLSTGQVITRRALDWTSAVVKETDWWQGLQLVLSAKEDLVVCSGEKRSALHHQRGDRVVPMAFSTSTGQVLHHHQRGRRERRGIGGIVTPSAVWNAFTEICPMGPSHQSVSPSMILLTTWNDGHELFVTSNEGDAFGDPANAGAHGLDIDRDLAFQMVHSEVCPPGDTELDSSSESLPLPRDPCMRLSVWRFLRYMKSGFQLSTEQSGTEITLPPWAGKSGRRYLEVVLPRTDEWVSGKLVQSKNGYVVFYSTRQGDLLVVDFWPEW